MSEAFLADACALIDYLLEPVGSMTAAGNRAMSADVLVSPVSIWEITLKAAAGKLRRPPLRDGSFPSYLASRGFRPLSLTWADAERANALPPLHKDPMDRMLIAQALNVGLPVITIDRLFEDYGVQRVW